MRMHEDGYVETHCKCGDLVKPVFQRGDREWYFWNETRGNKHGPFETKEEADAAYRKYEEDEHGEA